MQQCNENEVEFQYGIWFLIQMNNILLVLNFYYRQEGCLDMICFKQLCFALENRVFQHISELKYLDSKIINNSWDNWMRSCYFQFAFILSVTQTTFDLAWLYSFCIKRCYQCIKTQLKQAHMLKLCVYAICLKNDQPFLLFINLVPGA